MSICPLDRGWRLWTMFHNRFDAVPPDVAARLGAARQASLGEVIRTVDPVWEVADDDASRMPMTVTESQDAPWRFAQGSPWHLHTEFTVESELVHIDVCGAMRFGPQSFWNEVRIYANGELRGRGGACGCSLGGGGSDGPALALLAHSVVEVQTGPGLREAARHQGLRVAVRRRSN